MTTGGAGGSFEIGRFQKALAGAPTRRVARTIGETLLILQRAGSTQNEARALLDAGAQDGTVVLAMEQTEGRGRRGRIWISPPGAGLYATIILRGRICAEGAPWLTLAGAVVACEAARALGAAAAVKWPNDLVSGPRKLGGILGETHADRGATAALLGIGINVEPAAKAMPDPRGDESATLRGAGLRAEAGTEELLAEICRRFEEEICVLESEGPAEMVEKLRSLSPSAQGHRVVVEDADGRGTVRGVTRGIGPDGSLAVEEEPTGQITRVRFGGTLRLASSPAGDPR